MPKQIPAHIAVIMDGNGRWAKKRGLPPIAGHKKGADALKETVKACAEIGVKHLTVYAFSTENWGRPKEEVEELNRNNVRLRFLGRLGQFSEKLQAKMKESMEKLQNNTGLNLNVMVNYGGRAEIVDALQELLNSPHLNVGNISESDISDHLYTAGIPDPDLLIIFAYVALKQNWEPAHSAIFPIASIIALVSGIFLKREKDTIVDVSVTLLGMIYIGWFFSYFLFIRNMTEHGGYLFFLMLTIWANDVVAYFIGTKFGRTKLAPSISPRKTVEGAVAGFIVCLVASALFSWIAELNLTHALILGGLIGVVAVFSDLVESLIKRDAGVKDSSNLVPGHGGGLDRMDSFILAAPVMYYYLVWVVLR